MWLLLLLTGTGELSLLEVASEACGDTMRLALDFVSPFSFSLPGLLRLSRFRLTISSKYSSLLSLLPSFEEGDGLSFLAILAVNAEDISPSSESSFFSSSSRSLGLIVSSAVTFLASTGGRCGGCPFIA